MQANQLKSIGEQWTKLQELAAQGESPRLDEAGERFVAELRDLPTEDKSQVGQQLFPDGFDATAPWSPVLERFLRQAEVVLPAGAPQGGKLHAVQAAEAERKDAQPFAEELRGACEQAIGKIEKLAAERGVALPPDMDRDILLHDAIDQLKRDIKPKDLELLNRDPDFRQQVAEMVIKQMLMQQSAAAGGDGGLPPEGPGAGVLGAGGPGGLPPDLGPRLRGGGGKGPSADSWDALSEDRSARLLALINNPSIPIDRLVVMVVVLFAEEMDEKLRKKFEEFANNDAAVKELDAKIAQLQKQAAGAAPAEQVRLGQELEALKAQREERVQSAGTKEGANMMNLNAQIQLMMQRRTEMYNLMTNVIRQFHDMAMAAIRNIRG